MLQIQAIRQNPQEYIDRLSIRNIDADRIIKELLDIDEKKRAAQQLYDSLAADINSASKSIGALMAQNKKQEADEVKLKVATIKENQKSALQSLQELEEQFQNYLLNIANAPQKDVPRGKGEADNVVVKEAGEFPVFDFEAKPHWELAEKYNLFDLETGTKITGSGFILYKNYGAKLERALINFFLEYNTAAGYTELLTPFMVNEASALGTGQLPDKEGQMYHVNEDNLYLIPTAEVPVTNIYRDTITPVNELPIKLTAYSPCFRREAGSYGKDVRGLNRVHQFNKVEIVRLEVPEKSGDALQEMMNHVEGLLQKLELPYRILHLCGADLGHASANTYDFEVYSAAQKRWLEVSSVSNFETYQSNRMKARYRDADGKVQLLHTLNGSSLALPRIFASIIENYQTSTGIRIPTALRGFMGMDEIQ